MDRRGWKLVLITAVTTGLVLGVAHIARDGSWRDHPNVDWSQWIGRDVTDFEDEFGRADEVHNGGELMRRYSVRNQIVFIGGGYIIEYIRIPETEAIWMMSPEERKRRFPPVSRE